MREERGQRGRLLMDVKNIIATFLYRIIVLPHGEGVLLALKLIVLLSVIEVVRRYHGHVLVAQFLLGLFQAGSLKLGFHVAREVGVFLIFDQVGDGLEMIFVVSL